MQGVVLEPGPGHRKNWMQLGCPDRPHPIVCRHKGVEEESRLTEQDVVLHLKEEDVLEVSLQRGGVTQIYQQQVDVPTTEAEQLRFNQVALTVIVSRLRNWPDFT